MTFFLLEWTDVLIMDKKYIRRIRSSMSANDLEEMFSYILPTHQNQM